MNVHFAPWIAEHRPCWHCRDFRGLIYGGSAACCGSATGPRVRAMPEYGCSGVEREPGSDDEPDRIPVPMSFLRCASVAAHWDGGIVRCGVGKVPKNLNGGLTVGTVQRHR